ncbi:hypothetical protein BJ138DRAFT_1120571 [Hygrophoropsis aurantiaca]|uniref:Uncharacterized protein n=1 Tax=Hygrophoropsis aurantiaca TaxID=72124 RepID=A0ACB7ZRD4_9AGAM|nr:hypothetical protein BJ138DRAFT_1120571 [Hygrophoropsis aurantiaca]
MSGSLLSQFRMQQVSSVDAAPPNGSQAPSRARSMTPMSPTPSRSTPSLRRERSESDAAAEAQQEAKRLKKFADELCKDYNLPDDALDTFLPLDPTRMMVDLKASILALGGSTKKSAAQKYLDSAEFKVCLANLDTACASLT